MNDEVPARLVVQQGRFSDQEFELNHLQMTIGRSPNNDISFTDPEISRQHAKIVHEVSGFAIEDMGSTNGTFVNGERVASQTRLYHGDMINLGDAIDLKFFHEPSRRQTAEPMGEVTAVSP